MRSLVASAALLLIGACSAAARGRDARLSARPKTGVSPQCKAGLYPLHVAAERDAVLYVPASVPARDAPLLLYLHGATGEGPRAIRRLQQLADEQGVLLLAPSSREVTWDAIHEDLGPDVAIIDRALAATFARCDINPQRVAVGGFSDGASYALTLGLANGDLFRRVIAFSPCLISDQITPRGRPQFFISHGRDDDILPIDVCGRNVTRRLRSASYIVQFVEFDGVHEVRPEIAADAFSWLTR